MTIHILTPYSLSKDLGLAYNQACRPIPDNDWICLTDYDTLFLTSDSINIMYEYVRLNPDAGLLTPFTNRIHPTSPQLLDGKVSEVPDIKWHIEKAERQKELLYQTTELEKNISGFVMLFSKKTWNEVQFREGGGCLGVDTIFWRALKRAGKKILRMDGLYVFHTYRITQGIDNKKHLL